MSHTPSREPEERRTPKRGRLRESQMPLTSTLPRALSIAMLAPCPFPSHQGTQVMIRHLAEALTRVGHQVHFITYGYGEYEASFGFQVHRAFKVDAGLRSGPSFLKPAADAALALTAARVARTYACDLWHVHNIEGLALGALLKLQTGLPLVYHAHNAMGPELPTYFSGRTSRAVAGLLGDVLDRTLPRIADAVITFDADHQALHELCGVRADRIHVVPPGLDGSEIVAPDPATVARLEARLGKGPWLLYAGNPDTYQNLRLAWLALPRIRAERPDVRLLVASNHPRSAFLAELEAAGSPEGVVFEQYQTLDELKALFGVAAIGLSPRVLWSGAPVKILNYLAAGLPVVACPSGARHVLTSACGVLVDSTPTAFAAGVLQILAQPVGTVLARHRISESFCLDAQVPLYEAVYRQVLGAQLIGNVAALS
jgi:glycosyltransferase involved in cell wall biosynthesis